MSAVSTAESPNSSSASAPPLEHSQHNDHKPGFFNRMGRRLSEMSKMGLGDETHTGKLPEAQQMHDEQAQGKKQWQSHITEDFYRGKHETDDL